MSSNFYEERRRDRAADREADRADRLAQAQADREAAATHAEQRRKDRAEAEEQFRRVERERRRDADRRRAERRDRRAALRKRMLGAVAEHTTIPGLLPVLASLVLAWGGQFDAATAMGMGGYAPAVPLMLEGFTLALMILTTRAMTSGKPSGRLMAATWTSALVATVINAYGHLAEGGTGAGVRAVLFAAGSLAGVALWWIVATANRQRKTKEQRAEDKARARHAKNRRKTYKDVAVRADQIITAHPYGTIATERAWADAWTDIKGAPLGIDAASLTRRAAAVRSVEAVMADTATTPEAAAVELLLTELFPAFPGDDGPATETPTSGPQNGPQGGGGAGVRTSADKPADDPSALGRKGKQASGRISPKTPSKPLAETDLAKVRKLADALGGVDKLSARNVRDVIGGGAQDYAIRLRDAVRAEQDGRTPEN